MNRLILISFLLTLIVSCKKDNSKDETNEVPITTEVYYFDWNPDSVFYDTMIVDLNNDGINDLKFQIRKVQRGTRPSSGPYYDYFATCFSTNPQLKISLGTELNHNAREWNCLKSSDPISNNLTWYDHFDLHGEVAPIGGVGVWDKNDSVGYIGFKLNLNGVTHYGWIKVNVDFNTHDRYYKITCLEYAYSEVSEIAILTGQKE